MYRQQDGVVTRSVDATIEGVKVIPLASFSNHRGTVYHMLKATDPHFLGFGEIYFSTVYPGVVKAWKKHHLITVNYACILGQVKVALYDERASSSTKGVLMELFLGPDNYSLVVIPPALWHGFQGLSDPIAIIANCATAPNDPAEFDRLDPLSSHIPYSW